MAPAGWPRHRFGCLGCRATGGDWSRAYLGVPLVPASPRRSKQRLGHPADPPLLPICENLRNLWMTSSVPEMRAIGEEINPQITQIFTDWGKGEEGS